MSESAEAFAANVGSSRNVTIEISNNTDNFCLIDPDVHYESGHCHGPPQPVIAPHTVELCNFTKSSGKATGTVGVLSYDLWKRGNQVKEKMVIMFSVPKDYNFYKNWFGLGIYPLEKKVDENLFKEMYYNKEEGFVRAEANGSCLTFNGSEVDVMATMSPLGRCILKVELWEKLFSPCMRQGPY